MTGAKAKRVVQVFLKTLLPFAIATLMIPASCNGIVHCSIDQFACPDGSACISKSALCDGYTHCADWSDELATQCNSCTSSGLSKCRVDGTEFCIKEGAKCDSHCPVDQFACQTSHGRGPRAIGSVRPARSKCLPLGSVCNGIAHCSTDQFACHDSTQCVPKSKICNGVYWDGCADHSHTSAVLCNNCAAEHLFMCPSEGVNTCVNVKYRCDGNSICDDYSDELASQCDNCESSNLFKCKMDDKEICLANIRECDGLEHCSSDQFACHDGKQCIPKSKLCNGIPRDGCADGSHTSASLCNNCADDRLFFCQRNVVGYCINVKYECNSVIEKNCDNAKDILSKCGLTSPPCSSDQFACHDGTQCIPKTMMCNGKGGCADRSHTSAAQCNECAGEHLFKCQRVGKEVCFADEFKCNGIVDCDDAADEIASHCNDCADDHLFKCEHKGKEICRANKFKCDGRAHCDDAADEQIANCGNCTSDQFACHDGTQCIPKAWFCNGHTDCADYSDATVVQCNDCADENFFKCQKDGKYVCLANELKCDGAWHCDAQT